MSAPVTLDGLLRACAEADPAAPLYDFLDADGRPQAAWTRGGLLTAARRIATALVAADATGKPVLLVVGPGADQPAGLFGCFLAGATAVPVYPPAAAGADGAIAQVVVASGAAHLLAPKAVGGPLARALADRLGAAAPRLVALDAPGDAALALPGGRPEDAAIVLYTSGSTGEPKGAALTHAGFCANMAALAAACGRGAHDVIGTWLPHAHIAGLYTRLLAPALGARAVVLPAAAFAARPALWLDMLSRHRCTFSAAPDFAYQLLAQVYPEAALPDLDLSAWGFAVSGGEAVRAATLDRFAARFAPAGFDAAAYRPYYGLTETLCTSIPQAEPPARLVASRAGLVRGRLRAPADEADALTLVGNGAPLGAGTRVLAVDPEARRPVPAGQVGELWTRGPAVTPGYWNDPLRTGEACCAKLADGDGPWFRTGDLGLLHGGQVYVTGRLKELIIVRGKNHYPVDLEATVLEAVGPAGIQACAAFAVRQDDDEEALGLALELPAAGLDAEAREALQRGARRAVADRHGLMIHRLYLLPPGGLPRTATNKVGRAACRDLATGGAWDAARVGAARRPAAAPDAAVLALRELAGPALRAALLTELVALVRAGEGGDLPADQLERPIADLGLGSIDMARLAAGLRAKTGTEPPFAAFYEGGTLRDVAEAVATALEGGRPLVRPGEGWRDVVNAVARSLPDELPPRRTRPGRVFMTGATGFLGAWILYGLLRDGDAEVACLVRATDPAAGLERLINALRKGPGWDEAFRAKLHAVPGDVTAARCGLDEAAWDALADRTALIVHNAANVHFVAPYPSLAPVNVAPVHAIVDLAVRGGETRPVHMVSTTAVFNSTNRREQRLLLGSDRLVQPDYLYSGYAQSKWVAETAFRAANVGGLPLVIHRPGVIVGASTTGQSHADDFLCRFVKGCIELGAYPDADVELDLVPVDDVGLGIAAAARQDAPRPLFVCQWTAPTPVPMSALFEAFRRRGHGLAPQPLQDWLQRVRTGLPPDNALFPLHPFLLEVPPDTQDTILELFDGLPLRVDASEADHVRVLAGQRPHAADDALLDRMAAWLETSGFLPTPAPALA